MIIDFRHTPPTREGLARYRTPAPYMDGYVRALNDKLGEDTFGNAKYKPLRADVFIEHMDANQIDRVVLKSGDAETTHGSRLALEHLRDYVEGHQDRLIPIAGIDPHKGMTAIAQLETAVSDWGFRGVNLLPFEHLLYADASRYYPIYSKACELDVPVFLHTSVNFSSHVPMEYGHPKYLDQVAAHFPELTLIAVHGGWPWVTELCAVAMRHERVFIDISYLGPEFIRRGYSGVEGLVTYGGSVLQDRIIWGSNWPMGSWDHIAVIKSLGLEADVEKKWLGLNALEALGAVV